MSRVAAVSNRELIVLGTASQTPTRERNHNGYLLRWEDEGVLVDPGEGTQRQLRLAGVSPAAITMICITHFHGDHMLGLPGVLQRLALDGIRHPLDLYYPAAGQTVLEALLAVGMGGDLDLRPHPVQCEGVVAERPRFVLEGRWLDHRIPSLGWRIVEPDGRRMLPERLRAVGLEGPAVGRLQQQGAIRVGGRTVTVEDVSVARPGQRAAVVMDTRPCAGARDLAAADLLVIEATFLERDAGLADRYRHLTARQAVLLAAEAGARRVVLTHFSQRYADPRDYLAEVAGLHDDVIVAHDLLRVPVPLRAGC